MSNPDDIHGGVTFSSTSEYFREAENTVFGLAEVGRVEDEMDNDYRVFPSEGATVNELSDALELFSDHPFFYTISSGDGYLWVSIHENEDAIES